MSKMRLISLYLLLIFSTYSCNFIEINKQTIDDLIPDNTSLIIRIDNPSKFKSDLINNAVSLKLLANQTDYKFNEQIKIVEKFSEKQFSFFKNELNQLSVETLSPITKEMRKLLFNMVLTNEISEDAMHKILDTYYISGYGRK